MLSLNIPEYESAALRFIAEVMDGFLSLDPLFSGIERSKTVHRGPIRNVTGDAPLDQSMFDVRGEASLSWDTIRNGKIDDYTRFLADISESLRKSLARQFCKGISEVTDVTGRSINAKGKPLTVDMILDLMEKVEVRFDDDGQWPRDSMLFTASSLMRAGSTKRSPPWTTRCPTAFGPSCPSSPLSRSQLSTKRVASLWSVTIAAWETPSSPWATNRIVP